MEDIPATMGRTRPSDDRGDAMEVESYTEAAEGDEGRGEEKAVKGNISVCSERPNEICARDFALLGGKRPNEWIIGINIEFAGTRASQAGGAARGDRTERHDPRDRV